MVGPEESKASTGKLTACAVATVATLILLVHDLMSLDVLGWEIFFRDLILFVACFAFSIWCVRDYDREVRSRSRNKERGQGD